MNNNYGEIDGLKEGYEHVKEESDFQKRSRDIAENISIA